MTPADWPREVYLNGQIRPRSEAWISFEDRGFQYADGVYEVARSYEGKIFALDRHLVRLQQSAEFLELGMGPDLVGKVRDAAVRLLARSMLGSAAIVIEVTRGVGSRTHLPPSGMRPTVLVYVQPAVWPTPEVSRDGIRAITLSDSRWAHVNVKSIGLTANVLARMRAARAGADDAIFIRDGFVTDCPASNLFAVLDGVVVTPPESNYILSGITREAVLQLCRESHISCAERGIWEDDLHRAAELFVTGTTDEITPVVQVDGRQIGGGRPGPVTHRLMDAFRRLATGAQTSERRTQRPA